MGNLRKSIAKAMVFAFVLTKIIDVLNYAYRFFDVELGISDVIMGVIFIIVAIPLSIVVMDYLFKEHVYKDYVIKVKSPGNTRKTIAKLFVFIFVLEKTNVAFDNIIMYFNIGIGLSDLVVSIFIIIVSLSISYFITRYLFKK